MLNSLTIARNDLARAFLFKKGIFRCNELGEFVSCLSVDALSQDRGDVTKIECPSPDRYGEFIEVGTIPGELSRMTTTLTGRMSRTEKSMFYDLFIGGCPFDLHLHFGLCQTPDAFNQFDKALVFENVEVTSFSTEALVALQSADRAAINESIDISIGAWYEVVALAYNIRGAAQTTDDAIVAVDVCDAQSCGSECGNTSDGCSKIFAASSDFVMYFSTDGGTSWTRKVVDATPTALTTIVDAGCMKGYYVLVSSDGEIYYVNRDELIADPTGTVFGQFTGTVDAPAAFDAVNGFGVIVGATGQIGIMEDPDAGLVLIDDGFTTAANLLAVDVAPEATVAGGVAGAVVYSFDGEVWYLASVPVAQDITSTLVKNRFNWLVGTTSGQLWCTEDAGVSWARVKYPGWSTNTADISGLEKGTNHVVYMSSGAILYRSLDGGASWTKEPNSKATFPTISAINDIAVCHGNANFVVVGGVNATPTGELIIGSPA